MSSRQLNILLGLYRIRFTCHRLDIRCFGGNDMLKAIKMEVKLEEIIEAVKRMKK